MHPDISHNLCGNVLDDAFEVDIQSKANQIYHFHTIYGIF